MLLKARIWQWRRSNDRASPKAVGSESYSQLSVLCADLAEEKIVPLMEKGEPGKIVRI